MNPHPNITLNPAVMGGKPCIRGKRVTVGTSLGLMAAGKSHDAIVAEYPYLNQQDLRDALVRRIHESRPRGGPLGCMSGSTMPRMTS